MIFNQLSKEEAEKLQRKVPKVRDLIVHKRKQRKGLYDVYDGPFVVDEVYNGGEATTGEAAKFA